MKYIFIGAFVVMLMNVGFVGVMSFAVSIAFVIETLNPLWLAGMLVTVVCAAVFAKMISCIYKYL